MPESVSVESAEEDSLKDSTVDVHFELSADACQQPHVDLAA